LSATLASSASSFLNLTLNLALPGRDKANTLSGPLPSLSASSYRIVLRTEMFANVLKNLRDYGGSKEGKSCVIVVIASSPQVGYLFILSVIHAFHSYIDTLWAIGT
jgi:hypothetical protein